VNDLPVQWEQARLARRVFLDGLRQAARNADSANRAVAGAARGQLAVLRRGLAGLRQQADAYTVIYQFDPPEGEQATWLLVGALFALHPQVGTPGGSGLPPLAGALGLLAGEREGAAAAVDRRFGQLVGVDGAALGHYVRQAVQLLRAAGAPLDYDRLLDDLVVLMDTRPASADWDRRQHLRLRWIAEYNRARNSPAARRAG
jgi:CRISPR system Cascade subunit CasB